MRVDTAPDLTTTQELAERTGMRRTSICRLCARGAIPAQKLGGVQWFIDGDLDAFESIESAAKRIGISATRVCQLAQDGALAGATKLGGRSRV